MSQLPVNVGVFMSSVVEDRTEFAFGILKIRAVLQLQGASRTFEVWTLSGQ